MGDLARTLLQMVEFFRVSAADIAPELSPSKNPPSFPEETAAPQLVSAGT
jgi:hypothetical protein